MVIRKCAADGCVNNKPKRGFLCTTCRLLKQRYKITTPIRNNKLQSQNGKCLICSREISFSKENRMHNACVDHDHKTGKVRGIICGLCNTWLGYLENNSISLDLVKMYLE